MKRFIRKVRRWFARQTERTADWIIRDIQWHAFVAGVEHGVDFADSHDPDDGHAYPDDGQMGKWFSAYTGEGLT